ncbi:MAG: discoidin domain-containing protein [Bacillota bacterium]
MYIIVLRKFTYCLLSTVLILQLCFGNSFITIQKAYANTGSSLSVEFYNGSTSTIAGSIYLNYKVTNKGSTQVNLSGIKLRYYFTDDGISPIGVNIDYAANNSTGILTNVTYSINTTSAPNANRYIEFGFNSAAGSLAPNTSVILNSRFHQTYFTSSFDQSNDYSFCQSNTTYAAWNKVTAYLNGVLVSGTEPVTPSPASSATPTPTPTPTITPSSSTVSYTNLALGKTVVVSSEESGYGNVKAYAVDGNTGTRWSSAYSEPQWIYVDLGSSYSINRVKLNWENAYASSYKIQVSNDASNWTDVYSTTLGIGGIEDISFTARSGRYVRLYGIKRATQYGFSLWEFEVYGGSSTPAPSQTPAPTSAITATPTPTSTGGSLVNIAAGKTASSDSSLTNYPAASGNDNNTGTRWCAADGNWNHWWMVDLGASYSLTGSEVMWEFGGRVYKYKVEVSNNTTHWTMVADKTNNYSTLQVQGDSFSANARYVRITITGLESGSWASLWEFKVFGYSSASPTPSPTPTSGSIIKNGNFENGAASWNFSQNSASGANAYNIVYQDSTSNNISKSGISSTGDTDLSIQLQQGNVALNNSTRYRLSFDAWATVSRDIKIVIRNGTTYTSYFEKIQNIGTSKQTYTCEFVMNSPTDPAAQLSFQMGKVGTAVTQYHEVELDNVTMEIITGAVSPTPTITPAASPSSAASPTSSAVQANITLSKSAAAGDVELASTSDLKSLQNGSMSVKGTIEAQKEIVLVMDNSGSFNSYIADVPSPFDFGIFANNGLSIQGNEATINGSTYARSFSSTGSRLTISEKCSASSFYIITPTISVGRFENVTTPIEMPYFHSTLINEAYANSKIYDSNSFPPNVDVPMPGQTNINIRYDPSKSQFVITGSGTFQINSSMYFKGNLLISLPKTNNTGDSFLVADGDIILQGSSLSPSGSNDKVYVYSIGGNIEFQTSSSRINGIAYAPGSPLRPGTTGNVIFLGDGNTFNGSLAAQNFSFTAGTLTVNAPTGSMDAVESRYISTTSHLNSIKSAAKDFVGKFAGTKTKIGVIQYSDTANVNDFILYDLSVSSNVETLKGRIDGITAGTNGYSNMGDALRRANYLLNDSSQTGQYSSKYMVVLTGSSPNKWTSINAAKTAPKTNDGNANPDHLGGDGTIDSDGSSLNYAITIGNIIKQGTIEPIFIDYSPTDIEAKLEQIAESSGADLVASTGKHFYKADSINELKGIYDSVYLEIIYHIKLNGIQYEELLPEGVKVVEVPDGMSVLTEVVDGKTRYKVTGTINNVPLTFNGIHYVLSPYSFDIKVRYMKPGAITFNGSDAKMTYTINYTDSGGVKRTHALVRQFDDMTVNVKVSIDVS